MTWREVVLLEWECDSCGRTILSGDDGVPDGWYLDINDGHWCGCSRTVDEIEALEGVAL